MQQKQDGTIDIATMRGYLLPERHRTFTAVRTTRAAQRAADRRRCSQQKPAWKEVFAAARAAAPSRPFLDGLHTGTQEEIRRRAAMMASVDEGVGMLLHETLERRAFCENTFILFLGDNGFFFGEHGLGAERRFAYEEGIRTRVLRRATRS